MEKQGGSISNKVIKKRAERHQDTGLTRKKFGDRAKASRHVALLLATPPFGFGSLGTPAHFSFFGGSELAPGLDRTETAGRILSKDAVYRSPFLKGGPRGDKK